MTSRLEFQLLGFPAARLGARAVDLSLRKGLALIAYLADTRGPAGREQMAALLWPEFDAEAARGRLRRTLYRIRAAFGEDVIEANRSSIAIAPAIDLSVDTHAFEAACDRGESDEALRLYGGDFLDGFAVEGSPLFDEWAFFRREALRSRLLQTLERLIERALAGGDPRSAIPAATRLVGLDPLNEAGQRHLIEAYLQAGDRAAAEQQYAALAKLLETELGVAPDVQTQALMAAHRAGNGGQAPRTRYVERDGLHLAYQIVGSGPIDIVPVAGFVSHVERAWEEPRLRAMLTELSRIGRVILFDRRGIGLSDRIGAPPTVEATADDLRTVMDAAGCRKVLLLGASEGGPGCIHFAARHPERLAGLVLYGSMAKGSWAEDYPFALTGKQYDAWLRRLVGEWGGPAELATFAPSVAGDKQMEGWWSGLLRAASSPGAIKAVLEALRDADVRPLLPQIRTPTLVLHRRGDRAVRIEAGRHLAAAIPGARFVELDGDDHLFWVGDKESVLEQIREFARSVSQR